MGGIATIARDMRPNIKIYGVQTELYPSMKLAVEGKEITCGGETLAEGIAVKKPGGVTLPVVDALVDEILLVNERELEWAVGALIEQQRVVSEEERDQARFQFLCYAFGSIRGPERASAGDTAACKRQDCRRRAPDSQDL